MDTLSENAPMQASPPSSATAAVNGDREKLKLKVRRVAIDTHLENVVYLHRDCGVYRTEGFRALSKVEVMHGGRSVRATLNVADDQCIVGPDEVGLSEDAFRRLGAEGGARAGDPVKAPRRRRLGQARQFLGADAGLEVKDADRWFFGQISLQRLSGKR